VARELYRRRPSRQAFVEVQIVCRRDRQGYEVEENQMVRSSPYSLALPPEALRYRNIRSYSEMLFWILLLFGLLALGVPRHLQPLASAALVVLLLLTVTVEIPVVNRALVRLTSYEVDDCAVRIRRGLLFERTIVLPTAQLVIVTVIEGPLLRRFGLAVVVFSCASTAERLGPLRRAEAHRVRSGALNLLGAGSFIEKDSAARPTRCATADGSDRG